MLMCWLVRFILVYVGNELVAYRGYSYSEGVPSFGGLKEDGRAVLSWALDEQKMFNPNKIVMHGNSLGAAVVLHTLSQFALGSRIKGAIIENTFTSIGDMVDIIYPKLKIFQKLILRNNWNNRQYIDKLPKNIQIYFSTGKKDEITPTHMLLELYKQCSIKNKTLVEYPEGHHNDTWYVHKNEYFTNLKNFYDEIVE